MEIHLEIGVYEELEKVVDEFELDSYSETIKMLVRFFQKYRPKEWEIKMLD